MVSPPHPAVRLAQTNFYKPEPQPTNVDETAAETLCEIPIGLDDLRTKEASDPIPVVISLGVRIWLLIHTQEDGASNDIKRGRRLFKTGDTAKLTGILSKSTFDIFRTVRSQVSNYNEL